MSNQNIFKYDDVLIVLNSLIKIDEFENDDHIKKQIISNTIVDLKDNNKEITKINILKQLNKELERVINKPDQKYFIILHLQMKENFLNRNQITIDNQTFYIINHTQLKRRFNEPDNYTTINPKIKEVFENTDGNFSWFLVTSINSKDQLSAYNHITGKFYLLISILNFSIKAGTLPFSFYNPIHLGKVFPPSYTMIFNDKKELLNYFGLFEEYPILKRPINNKNLKHFYFIINKYNRSKKNTIRTLFENSIKLYGDSLFSYDMNIAYLYLWQTFEIISLKEKDNISEKQVCERVKKIAYIYQIRKEVIDALYKKRNQIVHKSINSKVSNEELRTLRLLSEELILFILHRINLFENKEFLKYWYENKLLSKESLKMKKKVVNLLIRS